MRMTHKVMFATASAIALLSACSDSATAPTAARVASTPSFALGDTPAPTPNPVLGSLVVCKAGDAGGQFTVTRAPAGASTGQVLSGTIAAGTCLEVASDAGGNGIGSFVSIAETDAPNVTELGQTACRIITAPTNAISDCALNAANRFINSFHGYVITYTNRADAPPPPVGCTFTQGYWKNHGPVTKGNQSNEWPVTSLMLGTVNYSDAQLLAIFNTAVKGNGLISLAHQLIAAKLNIANGASGASISASITAADVLIGGLVVPPVGSGSLTPGSVSALVTALTNFNEGKIGPGHCSE